MSSTMLDSRLSLGSDVQRRSRVESIYTESSFIFTGFYQTRMIRVILARFADVYRLTAIELDIVVEGDSIERAWKEFLNRVNNNEDASWLTFDVGPTRTDEIVTGLDISEDEDWSEPINEDGAND